MLSQQGYPFLTLVSDFPNHLSAQNKLSMYRAAFQAVEVDPQNARQYISAMSLRDLHSAEDNMRTVLAPWLHKDRLLLADRKGEIVPLLSQTT